MPTQDITYTDKVPSVSPPNPVEEQVRAADFNEIKTVVNANADQTDTNESDITTLNSSVSGLSTNITELAAEQIDGFIETPDDKEYILRLKSSYAGTITETTTKCVSGTCTATFAIESTNLGGTSNAVSSTEQDQAHASNNTFAVGDTIKLTISSNSSCTDMSFSVKFTKTTS